MSRSVKKMAFRCGFAVVATLTTCCAGDFVNHRLDLPGSQSVRLNVYDSSGTLLKIIREPNSIKAFDAAVDRIDRWFDDVFGAAGVTQYSVQLIGSDGEVVGSLWITAKYLRTPPKSAAKITRTERDELLRILGIM